MPKKLIPWFKLYNFRTRVLFMYVDTQLDTQNHLHGLSIVYTSEHQTLLPSAYFHVALEQVAGNGEMLDIILEYSSITV